MEKICKNCLHWRQEPLFLPKGAGTCVTLTSLKKESGEIKDFARTDFSHIKQGDLVSSEHGVATGEYYGKDCEYFSAKGAEGISGHPDPVGCSKLEAEYLSNRNKA